MQSCRFSDMAFTQLDPPLPMTVEDRGDGYAVAVIDYGQEFDLLWVVALDASGEIWCAPNPKVRMQGNWSMGRARPNLGKSSPKIASIA
ncbi:hypothetical protein SPAN111604_10845 [Sphingomonas antarctica]